jgi:AcrR family transcriptional regulator
MAAPATDRDARTRVMDAMATVVAGKGYAAVTIDDIARLARTSKRTFYAQFPDKERCFLAAYEAASERVLTSVVAAAPPTLPWRTRLDAAIEAYLAALAAHPEVTRVFHIEIQAAGPDALELRHQVNRRYAKFLRRVVREGGEATLSAPMATAIQGAINELVLDAVVEDRTRRLPALAAVVAPLVDAALAA